MDIRNDVEEILRSSFYITYPEINWNKVSIFPIIGRFGFIPIEAVTTDIDGRKYGLVESNLLINFDITNQNHLDWLELYDSKYIIKVFPTPKPLSGFCYTGSNVVEMIKDNSLLDWLELFVGSKTNISKIRLMIFDADLAFSWQMTNDPLCKAILNDLFKSNDHKPIK